MFDKDVTPKPIKLPRCGERAGSAILWRSDEGGWSTPPLLLPNPLLNLRVDQYGTRVETPQGDVIASHTDRGVIPFRWIEEILSVFTDSTAGTERRLFKSPAFPVAVFSSSYEFGRTFNPHENCFPYHRQAEVDDLFVSFHSTGLVHHEGRWTIVGRLPSRRTTWRNWQISLKAAEWPKPPKFVTPSPALNAPPSIELTPSLSREQYAAAFERIRDHLNRGDIYQANLTNRFEARVMCDPDKVFANLLSFGGDRFASMMRMPGMSHISVSPELFLRKLGHSIVTKPIKGTRLRRRDQSLEDVKNELSRSLKDRAEHVMIVDLERNDLGRLCEFGSIRVSPLMEATTHPNLIHLESTVQGTLRPNTSFKDIFAALFPGGSVTGAPKKRALEIIGEVETRPRGIYCGALGWVDYRGDCELNLPIRTSTVHDNGRVHMYSGGGIVADSTAESEWFEMEGKLDIMRRAVEMAAREGIA